MSAMTGVIKIAASKLVFRETHQGSLFALHDRRVHGSPGEKSTNQKT
jgi:hypothetical protein